MDTLIKNGDLFIDENGGLVKITDEEEKLQRALFVLSTEKGSFNFDRELGSKLSDLGEYDDEKINSAALEIVSDALVGIEGITVESASVEKSGTDYIIKLSIYIQSRKRLVKIKI